jgi:hypothetical protein
VTGSPPKTVQITSSRVEQPRFALLRACTATGREGPKDRIMCEHGRRRWRHRGHGLPRTRHQTNHRQPHQGPMFNVPIMRPRAPSWAPDRRCIAGISSELHGQLQTLCKAWSSRPSPRYYWRPTVGTTPAGVPLQTRPMLRQMQQYAPGCTWVQRERHQ